MAIIDIVPGLHNRSIHEVNTGSVPFGNNAYSGTQNFNVQNYVNQQANPPPTNNNGSISANPFIRDVTDDELVENRLTRMLRSDSEYVRQARESGRQAALERGGLSGSMFAGASQAAAIQAAAPIAQADAMAFRQAQSENLQAMNANVLAKLQSATQLQVATANSQAAIRAAEINAEANKELAAMRMEHDKAMFGLSAGHDTDMFGLTAGHDTFMEQLRQEGRIDLTTLSHSQQRILQEMGFEHNIDMADLTFEQKVQLEEQFANPRFYAGLDMQKSQFMIGAAMGLLGTYSDGINSMHFSEIDDAGFNRGASFFQQLVGAGFQLLKGLWGDDFDFDIVFGGGG